MAHNVNTNYRIQIKEAIFRVKKIQPSEDVLLSHSEILYKDGVTARYPINCIVEKTMLIPQGSTKFTWDNAFLDNIPSRCVTFFLEQNRFTGQYDLNPFNLKHMNLQSFDVLRNGVSVTGQRQPLNFDFQRFKYLDGFTTLFRSNNQNYKDIGGAVDRLTYVNGSFFIITDFSCDASGGLEEYKDPSYKGSIRMELQFKNPLPSSTLIYVIAHQKKLIEITSDREVLLNY